MLGKRLTELRKKRKLTQVQIAEKLHISRSTYAQYEVDRRVPEYATLEKLADFFEVSIDYLVGRDTPYSEPTNDQTELVFKQMVERYHINLDDPNKKDKLEQLIKIVFDDKNNTKDS